jgi:hypothetical protein
MLLALRTNERSGQPVGMVSTWPIRIESFFKLFERRKVAALTR